MRNHRLTVVIGLVLIGLTACGSSSKNASRSSASTTSANTPTQGSTASTTTTGSLNGSGSSSFCDLARKHNAFSAASATPTSPVDLKKAYANLGPELKQIGSVVPGAIKGDFNTFVVAFNPFLNAIAAANYDFTKVSPSVFQALSSPQVKAAGVAIRQYMTQVCKVTPPT